MNSKAPKTRTAPVGELPPPIDGPDLITAIRRYGGATETSLLAGQPSFTLGSSPECNIVLESPYVTSLHAVLERRGQRVRVHDSNSRNGTAYAGRREMTFDIGPGDVFTAGTVQLLVLNEDMRLMRPKLAEALGFDRDAIVDDVLVASVRGGPLLILGEDREAHAILANAIHAASLRRRMPLVAVPALPESRTEQRRIVDQAAKGSVVLHVSEAPTDDSFLSLAFSAAYHVRLIVTAPTLEIATQSLGLRYVSRLQQIEVRPLRERLGDIPTLLDRMFLDLRASLRVSDLKPENQRALTRCGWPEGFAELRLAAERIVKLAALGGKATQRSAAKAVDMPKTTLLEWLDGLGIALPLTK